MTPTFKRAERAAKKARIAIYGPSGSGKTYTALSLATGLGKKIAFIDTERGSAQLYADKFVFDSLSLTSFHPDRFVEAIAAAEDAGYDTVIIDSLSHAWNAILDAVGARGGNTFTDGWGKIGTPLYTKLIGAILESKCHVIVCMRSKVEYEIEKNEKGKAEPKKIGTAPVMRADTEYEFDLVLTMDDANNATVSKTRMGELLQQRTNRPDAAIGRKIGEWLASGKPIEVDKARVAVGLPSEIPSGLTPQHKPEPKPINDEGDDLMRSARARWAKAATAAQKAKRADAIVKIDGITDPAAIEDAAAKIEKELEAVPA
jgi:ABC-type dipeptide/oligopeptide/nickel transport system ATPase component